MSNHLLRKVNVNRQNGVRCPSVKKCQTPLLLVLDINMLKPLQRKTSKRFPKKSCSSNGQINGFFFIFQNVRFLGLSSSIKIKPGGILVSNVCNPPGCNNAMTK